jgi:hypothetical protein
MLAQPVLSLPNIGYHPYLPTEEATMKTHRLVLYLGMGLGIAGCGADHTSLAPTSAEAPQIVAMSPAPEQSFVAADQSFMVEFSAAMDLRSVEGAYQVIVAHKPVAGNYTWDSESRVMHFQPAAALAPNAEVQVRMGSGMRSQTGQRVVGQDGQPLGPFEFSCRSYLSPGEFTSNGQRIYYTSTSASGEPITFAMGTDFGGSDLPGYGMAGWGMMGTGMMGTGMMGGGMMGAGMHQGGWMGSGRGGHYGMACVTCHGPDGKGGLYLAMGIVRTPNIQYGVLTGQTVPEEETEEHPHVPYNDELIKQAITEGLEPDGEPLNPFMPRWSMAAPDLEDLLAFLKTL